ncbi:MAG: heparinase, partial [Caulobacteraceae bacterium]
MAPRPPQAQGGAPSAPLPLVLAGAAETVWRRLADEWRTLGVGRRGPARTRSLKLIATPRDFRPTDPEHGRTVIAGRFPMAGVEMDVGPGGDPWDRPSPTRRFAVELHRFAFLPDLAACGAPGAKEGLRLFLDWRRAFGRPDAFAWGPEVLERRVFNLACAARRLSGVASDVEAAELFGALLQ